MRHLTKICAFNLITLQKWSIVLQPGSIECTFNIRTRYIKCLNFVGKTANVEKKHNCLHRESDTAFERQRFNHKTRKTDWPFFAVKKKKFAAKDLFFSAYLHLFTQTSSWVHENEESHLTQNHNRTEVSRAGIYTAKKIGEKSFDRRFVSCYAMQLCNFRQQRILRKSTILLSMQLIS